MIDYGEVNYNFDKTFLKDPYRGRTLQEWRGDVYSPSIIHLTECPSAL
jgi:hypothetical protein